MAKQTTGKAGSRATLSKDTDNGRAQSKAQGKAQASNGDWVTLRRASEETGVSISTLRSWYRKGVVDSRVEKGPNGSQRIVRLEEIAGRAKRADKTEATDAHTREPRADGVALPNELREMIDELAEARERAGRAEARADFLARELTDLRARPSDQREHVAALEAENRMLRARLDMMLRQAEEMARRLSAIEGEPDEIDLTQNGEPALPPEEEDEYLALAQRWKARRIRRKAARREARAART